MIYTFQLVLMVDQPYDRVLQRINVPSATFALPIRVAIFLNPAHVWCLYFYVSACCMSCILFLGVCPNGDLALPEPVVCSSDLNCPFNYQCLSSVCCSKANNVLTLPPPNPNRCPDGSEPLDSPPSCSPDIHCPIGFACSSSLRKCCRFLAGKSLYFCYNLSKLLPSVLTYSSFVIARFYWKHFSICRQRNRTIQKACLAWGHKPLAYSIVFFTNVITMNTCFIITELRLLSTCTSWIFAC